MTDTRPSVPASLDHETVQTVSKLVLATLSLVFILYLVSILPGIDRFVPGTPVTVAAIVGAVVTIAIVGLLCYLAPTLAELVRSTLHGPEAVVEDVAAIVHLFVVLIAVLVAHRGLAPAIVPLLDGMAWTYDVLFLAFALPPLAILAARLYVSLDPISELLADRMTRSTASDE